jgi:hypothetical protein
MSIGTRMVTALVEAKTVAPEEIRGKDIGGGRSRQLAKGDVIIVPNGVPHWFQEVQGLFTYYVVTDLTSPNGIALSPDEQYLYVGNWDAQKKVVMRYEAKADGTVANGQVFFDMTNAPGEEAIDGLKVDQHGNLYVSGPGGLWVLSPTGTHLGTITAPRHIHNMAWGDADGKTLYLCARSVLYRMQLGIPGTPLANGRSAMESRQ